MTTTITASEPPEPSLISKMISRIRPRTKQNMPKPIIPRDTRRPLISAPLPLVLPKHQQTFRNLGWTTVTFPQPIPSSGDESTQEHAAPEHPLQKAYEDLFAASQAFFGLPVEEKMKWKTKLGSEEGWSSIPGEKEFITLRTLSYTPDILRGPAKRYWDLMGGYLDTCLGRLSTSLALPDSENEGLRRYVGACKRMGKDDDEKTATMLRLFRYEGWEKKVVAEPHADLGLLSCVVGDVPGLEVWDGRNFFDVERRYNVPCATLLGGRQLERLSNFRFSAGGHRVVSYGTPAPNTDGSAATDNPKYRFSIVFVLRAHEPVIVDTDAITTDVTGEFKTPVKGVTAGQWYEQIRGAHFNINTGMEEREVQRRKIEEKKKKGTEGTKGSG